MAKPTQTGSAVVLALPASATPGAQSVTVPSDATHAVIFWGLWAGGAGINLDASSSGNFFSSLNITQLPLDGNFNNIGVAWAAVTATGSRTFTPVWTNVPGRGPAALILFYKDVDSVIDTDVNTTSGAASISLSSTDTTNDLVIGAETQDGGAPAMPSSGWTDVSAGGTLVNGMGMRVRTLNTTTNPSVVASEGSSYACVAGIVIRGTSGSGPQTVLPPLLTNTNTLYAPSVANASGPQTVLPPLLTNTNTLYAPTVRQIPVLSLPTAVGETNALILAGVTTSLGSGTLYMVATVSATPPSAAQIMAGQDNTGAAAAFAGNLSVSSTGAKSFNASGLAQLTTYNCFFYHDVGGGYGSNIVTAAAATFRDGGTGQDILDNTGPIGGNPAGILYNDVQAGDEAKWFSFVITTPPVNDADFEIDVLGRFTYVGPDPDEFYYQLEVDGANVGSPQRVELYDHDGAQDVAPPLLTNTQAFYGPTVLRGAVNVLPPLFTNPNTLYAPTVVPQAQSVAPPLLTNTQTFYGPTVVAGPLNVSPPLLTNTNTLYGPTVSGGTTTVIAPLLVNNQTFFGPTVVVGAVTVLPSLLVNTNTIFAPRVRHVVPPVPGEGQPPRLAIGIRLGL